MRQWSGCLNSWTSSVKNTSNDLLYYVYLLSVKSKFNDNLSDSKAKRIVVAKLIYKENRRDNDTKKRLIKKMKIQLLI